ncbi:Nin one binding Zn-ribbon like-domain-containing protein [Irpex rosettiformis]|uniref:Nin one binding Zn-ribbon like-domain-containing protein n=1 Tax=Irpex rosettiformis TaxID=378272 RepID=A0ACB8U3W1_9APHY|nr:Nin one binding Zn-ribbon like-domain-containing protein [Irpex rosettiformis]
MAFTSENKPACKHLILDAGPLLSLSPLRGLAETFYTVPQVLDELKDKRAREHFEKLGLSAGVRVQVQSPDAQSLAHVIQFAKKTGDYSVLSTADLCVLALTYALEQKEINEEEKNVSQETDTTTAESSTVEVGPIPSAPETSLEEAISKLEISGDPSTGNTEDLPEEGEDEQTEREPLDVQLERVQDEHPNASSHPEPTSASDSPLSQTSQVHEEEADDTLLYSDPSSDDDGEGEWITPSNVSLHKSRALGFIPDESNNGKKRSPARQIRAGCMTADFAMQNVLLQMGLALVGVEGKRIERVKTWVLRCHACFKICKDSSRKFCPTCGSPTLLRASVTLSSPTATSSTPTLQVHLKKNFQYKTRGTIFSIPAPKPGTAKTGSGEGLVLREDQSAWVKAKKHADGKREREEKRLLKSGGGGGDGGNGLRGSWMDPDWVPEMLSVGTGGKGRSMRSSGYDGDMPVIGYGRKNPNERRRKK